MSPAAVQLWEPRHNYKMESWKFSTGDKGPVPPPASRRWKNTRAPAEKLISPLNARLLYVGRVLELKWAPRKPASAGRGAAFYGQRPWKPKACSSLSSSPSSLVFFFILRRPRYTSGERLQTVTRWNRCGERWWHLSFAKFSPFFLVFFFLFQVSTSN